jgi:ribosomal protein S18 acetylase RimI-like enzyme
VIDHRVHTRSDVAELMRQLATWDAGDSYVRGIHVGDVAWCLRLPDERLGGQVHGWWSEGGLVAAAIVEDGVARPRIAPHLVHDVAVADDVADFLESLRDQQVWSEAANGSRLRQLLAVRGWTPHPDPWIALYADPSSGRASDRLEPATADPDARVAVQRAGFDNSTFDRASWERMAALPSYDADLDLVLRDEDGSAVAAATAWLVGHATAVVEPFAVHREHRRRGHGTVLARALVAACVEKGATGVSVCTPANNPGAVQTYRAGGFHAVESLQDMVRPRR